MAMVINSNIASLTSQRHLSQSRNDMEVAMERMSSGRRINSSMDDAAGLAIGNRMTSQIEGLNQAIRNANDGISLAQTAESALDSHSGILQRMRVLAVQSANDTYSTLDRKTLNNEIVQLKEELNRSVSEAAFNGQKILDGSSANFTFQIGHTAQDTVDISLSNMSGSQIGTQTWADKAGVTAPATSSEVVGSAAVPEVDTHTYSAEVTGAGGTYEFLHDGTTYTGAWESGDADGAAAMGRLATDINDANLGFTASATSGTALTVTANSGSDTQMTKGTAGSSIVSTSSGTTIALQTADTTPGKGEDAAAVPEVDTHTYSAEVTGAGGTYEFLHDGTTYTGAWESGDADGAAAMGRLATDINAASLGFTASATSGTVLTVTANSGSDTQMTKGTVGSSVVSTSPGAAIALQTADTTPGKGEGAADVAEQESYDFSDITLATGDRLTLTIGGETYVQEFATDQETTLKALGALVVNGETGYVSKGLVNGALVFVGNADGTAMAAATMAVETATVTAANSIDDVLVTDSTSAKHALTVVDDALEMMADFRSRMGAVSNRMFHTIDNLMSVSENTSAARSRIVDADFAAESASLAKSQILQKAGTAMLSQANASTQDILSLLK